MRNNLAICQSVFPWIASRRLSCMFIGSQMSTFQNAYGLSKQMGEYWAGQIEHCQIARLWNIYGLEPDINQRSHVISDLIRTGLQGTVRCATNGLERRQFLYVKDCVDALIHQRRTGQALADLTTDEWITIREVAGIVADELGVEAAFGDAPGYKSLVDAKHSLGGWAPRYSIRDGIRDVLVQVG